MHKTTEKSNLQEAGELDDAPAKPLVVRFDQDQLIQVNNQETTLFCVFAGDGACYQVAVICHARGVI